MATQPNGIGRQRFDFTDATGSVTLSAGTGTVSTGGPGDDEQLVRLVDDQFKDLLTTITGSISGGVSMVELVSPQYAGLMAALGKGSGNNPPAVQVVELTSPQFTGLINNIKGGGGSKPGSNPLGLREIRLVELEDKQYKELIDTIKGSGGKARTQTGMQVPTSPTGGPDGFWENIRSLFRRGQGISTRTGIGRTTRLKTRRLGAGLKKSGAARAARGGAFNTAVGGAMQLGGGALLKAAGPIGLAVSAASAVAGAVADVFKAATSAVKMFGDMAVKVARNDGIGLLASGINAAAEAVGKIPVVGKVFAAGLELASAGLTTFKAVLDAFSARARELSVYNGQIAAAVAQADVAKMFADMRDANKNAKQYADLIIKSQRLDEDFQRALQPLKAAIMDLTIKLMPVVTSLARELGEFIGTFKEKMDVVTTQLNPFSTIAEKTTAIEAYNKKLYEIKQQEVNDKAFAATPIDAMLAQTGLIRISDGMIDPVNANAKNGMANPLLR